MIEPEEPREARMKKETVAPKTKQEALCESLRLHLPPEYECEPRFGMSDARVRTSFIFPDGEVLDVFVNEVNSKLVLSDYGVTQSWMLIWAQNPDATESDASHLLDTFAPIFGIEAKDGQLTVQCENVTEVSDGIHRMGQAVAAVTTKPPFVELRLPDDVESRSLAVY